MESTTTMSARRRIPRGANVVAVALVGAALGIGGALVASTSGGASDVNPPAVRATPGPTRAQSEALAEWAREKGLTGLSPASLQRVPNEPVGTSAYAGLDALSEWARANGLTGLSPASLQRVPTPTSEAIAGARLAELAEWARERGLTGLSPANMQQVPARP